VTPTGVFPLVSLPLVEHQSVSSLSLSLLESKRVATLLCPSLSLLVCDRPVRSCVRLAIRVRLCAAKLISISFLHIYIIYMYIYIYLSIYIHMYRDYLNLEDSFSLFLVESNGMEGTLAAITCA
jgi:hypothetical protein